VRALTALEDEASATIDSLPAQMVKALQRRRAANTEQL